MSPKKIIAFTFARAGSKGIINKNIKPLCGRPLIEYAIESGRTHPLINDVYVSTDGNEIAAIAAQAGAKVINRPEHLAADTASEWHAWQHAVEQLVQNNEMGLDDIFISLPATAPLRDAQDVTNALTQFSVSDADLALGITTADRSPYFNMVVQNDAGLIELVINEHNYVRRQDVPVVWDVTTVFYVSTARFILENTGVLSGKTLGIVVPKERAIDIDTQYDFDIAEFLMNKKVKNENP
ncbi:acylneuraminate cytidylyltransferase family protein [Pseudoalteromonas tunicata]|uniref:CMP-N-acetylneuraminic acid synthetase n=1 Tax=Pseudoalteromonas tunicata D2 TaxID=87626 RepID=A4C6E5_9GAMM|nr:acylneuraminate cytidylyltransferase family protein [Pseudoalteromonas tunicata]ATC95524.1 N-acylneuraminate cytidylyltransferase [Pseudoalteromonas tunicata]EAR29549.1 CMP-N-acetylneuraminic acid synthetase [Pseudoalteromonas tunicata D2]MDP4982521.1 acylneuraminate cytidylyltransferase family protein [Pseudoalteromonas tunicata]